MSRKSTEADDVLEFLDSLPETGKTKEQKGKGNGKDEDILEFLDELEKSNLDLSQQKNGNTSKSEAEPVVEGTSAPLNDPVTTFSNWWSSSGSAAVSNIWSKTTEHATQLQKIIAQEQQGIASRVINTNTITELAKNLQKIVVGETEEVLRVHLVHDMVHYPQLQDFIEDKFHQVMSSQVQGGIRIFVDEWGKPTDVVNKQHFQLNAFQGKIIDGEKLALANLDNAIKLYNKAREEIDKQHEQNKTGSDNDSDDESRISDIFISILPICIPTTSSTKEDLIHTTDSLHPGNFNFTVILKDITNNVTTITRSQGFPAKWIEWIESGTELRTKPASNDNGKVEPEESTALQQQQQEEEEEEIIDPSEWVKQWIDDGMNLTCGIVAQNYVIERMGF